MAAKLSEQERQMHSHSACRGTELVELAYPDRSQTRLGLSRQIAVGYRSTLRLSP